MDAITILSVRNHVSQMQQAAEQRPNGQADAMALKVCLQCIDDCIAFREAERERRRADIAWEIAKKKLFYGEMA